MPIALSSGSEVEKMDPTLVPVPRPHIADYIIIVIFLCICMGIGIYYAYKSKKKQTLENYFLGNRRLLLLPVAMSLFKTFASAVSLMGFPAEVYVYGIRGIYITGGFFLSAMIASVTVVPVLYPLQLTSTYEYLQLRFRSKGVRTLGTVIGMIQTVIFMGVSLYAPALALQIVAGIPLWLSVVVIALVATAYTVIGGIKSVVWADTFQLGMIFVGLSAVTIKGSLLMPTNHSIIDIATEGGRLQFFNFDPDPRTRHTIWGTWIGTIFSYLSNWCNQFCVQRVSTLRSLEGAKRAFRIMGVAVSLYDIVLGYLGILLYSYYNAMNCDPVQAGFLSNFNQLMPYFVLDVLRSLPGLSGIYISCLFSGALSSLASGINSLAANTVEDILGNYVKKSKIIVAKIFVLSYGLVVIGLAYIINSMSGSVMQMAVVVFGVCGGPLAGLYFLGGMIPKANWKGAIAGSLTALVFTMWITVGSQMYGVKAVKLPQNPTSGCYHGNSTVAINETFMIRYNATMIPKLYDVTETSELPPNSSLTSYDGFFLYNISYVWYGFIGFFLTLIIGTVVSLCTGGDGGEPVEARLLFPICRKIFGVESKSKYKEAELEEKVFLSQNNSTDNGPYTSTPVVSI